MTRQTLRVTSCSRRSTGRRRSRIYGFQPAQKLRTSTRGSPPRIAPSRYDPDYADALTYKNILLRMKANAEADPAIRQALVAEADALRNRAMELQKTRQSGRANMAFVPAPGQPPPPPPPPPPPVELVDGQAPVRVGGNIKPPTKTRDVKPVYPADALDARVTGRRHHRSHDRFAGQRQHRACASRPAPARPGRPRRSQGVAVYADDDERRGGAGDHDRDGELHDERAGTVRPYEPDLWRRPPPPPPPPAELVDGQAPCGSAGISSRPRRSVTSSRSTRPTRWLRSVQGVVILEATIDSSGQRQHARVLRRSAAAGSSRRRRRQPVAVRADAAERRGRAGHHDGDGELHAAVVALEALGSGSGTEHIDHMAR